VNCAEGRVRRGCGAAGVRGRYAHLANQQDTTSKKHVRNAMLPTKYLPDNPPGIKWNGQQCDCPCHVNPMNHVIPCCDRHPSHELMSNWMKRIEEDNNA